MDSRIQETLIHPTAVVAAEARLGHGVEIGPFCVIGPEVTLADNVRLKSHVVVDGITTIGEGTEVFPFASLGTIPQDLKYKGEKSRLEIGRNNRIREHVTMNPGTEGGGMITRVGDHCLFMMAAHVAHDCQIGNHVILANNATLGGHVVVGDFAILGGLTAVHQFVRIGAHAMIGGMSGVENDVIPYGSVIGERGWLQGLNIVGLKRRGFKKNDLHALRRAYRALFAGTGSLSDRIDEVARDFAGYAAVEEVVDFLRGDTSRAICRPRERQETTAGPGGSSADSG